MAVGQRLGIGREYAVSDGRWHQRAGRDWKSSGARHRKYWMTTVTSAAVGPAHSTVLCSPVAGRGTTTGYPGREAAWSESTQACSLFPGSGTRPPADGTRPIQSLDSEDDGPHRWAAGRLPGPLRPAAGAVLVVPTLFGPHSTPSSNATRLSTMQRSVGTLTRQRCKPGTFSLQSSRFQPTGV
jgi:hypothetical protein